MEKSWILNIHKDIVSKGGIIPKNLSWIMLIPGKYIISNDRDESIAFEPTFMDLRDSGLLMCIFYHPYKEESLLFLCSLQPKFILAEKLKNNLYILKNIESENFTNKLEEMKLESYINYKIG